MQRRIFRTRIESEVLSVVSLVCSACLCVAEINKNLLSINLNPLEADSISLTLPHLPLSCSSLRRDLPLLCFVYESVLCDFKLISFPYVFLIRIASV